MHAAYTIDSLHSLAHYFSMFLQYCLFILLTVTVNMLSWCMNVWIAAPCGSWFLKFHARVGLLGAILVGHPYLQWRLDRGSNWCILFHTIVILCPNCNNHVQGCARMCKVMWRDWGPSKSPKASASSSDKPSRWPKKWAWTVRARVDDPEGRRDQESQLRYWWYCNRLYSVKNKIHNITAIRYSSSFRLEKSRVKSKKTPKVLSFDLTPACNSSPSDLSPFPGEGHGRAPRSCCRYWRPAVVSSQGMDVSYVSWCFMTGAVSSACLDTGAIWKYPPHTAIPGQDTCWCSSSRKDPFRRLAKVEAPACNSREFCGIKALIAALGPSGPMTTSATPTYCLHDVLICIR